MTRLSELSENAKAVIAQIDGDSRFVNRAVSIGLTPGSQVMIVKNTKNRPLLVYSRDTMIALNRKECENIMTEEIDSKVEA